MGLLKAVRPCAAIRSIRRSPALAGALAAAALLAPAVAGGAPAPRVAGATQAEANVMVSRLTVLGYLPRGKAHSRARVVSALRRFQRRAGLRPTGVYTQRTAHALVTAVRAYRHEHPAGDPPPPVTPPVTPPAAGSGARGTEVTGVSTSVTPPKPDPVTPPPDPVTPPPEPPPDPGPSTANSCSTGSGFRYTTDWVGNSFGGRDGRWIPHGMQGMTVLPDGTVYTSALWEEGGRELGGFKDGDVWGPNPGLHGNGGSAVVADGSYIYTGTTDGQIKRYSRALFDSYKGHTGYEPGTSMHVGGYAGGIALYGGELFVANPDGGYTGSDSRLAENTKVNVYDAGAFNGQVKRSWSVPRARQMAFDGAGYLWVLQQRDDSNPPRILRYDRNGQLQSQRIEGIDDPISIAIDPRGGNRMLIGDNGPDQNVKIYRDITTSPSLEGTFGTKGGYLAGPRPGVTGPLRFDGPKGVGIDSAGNIYVASTGTAGVGDRIWSMYEYGRQLVLESYKPDGTLNWRREGLEFVDRGGLDPSGGSNVYTSDEHLTMDYGKATGQGWGYRAHTLDPFKYPSDGRIQRGGTTTASNSTWMRRFAGGRFLFTTGMYGGYMTVHKLSDADEIAVPAGSVPFYNDPYFTGMWPDTNGDVWQATRSGGIKRFRMQGLTGGNPTYSQAAMDSYPMPAPFVDLRRIEYHPDTDTLYLSGYTSANFDNTSMDSWKASGATIARYDHWLAGNRTPRFVLNVTPYSMLNSYDGLNKPLSMAIAGDYIFVGWIADLPNYGQQVIRVYRASDGAYVGIIKDRPEVGPSGWFDLYYSIDAYQRPNGEYVVLGEEDGNAKNLIHRVCF